MGGPPSKGLPNGSTTRPRKPFPTGVSKTFPGAADLVALLDPLIGAEDSYAHGVLG
jgi:hypothetical protein